MTTAASAQKAEVPVFRIALAEDNPADVMLVRMALREAGVHCHLAVFEDGEQAMNFIEALETDPAARMDLFLLDLNLPRLDGTDILRRLRSSESHAGTPVVLMTASDDPRNAEEAANPATRHFRKPPSFADYMQLGSIIRKALS